MAHTLELLPDDDLDEDVRRLWRRLAAAGLPSQAAHPHPTNRPHLTLTVVDVLPPDGRDAVAAALAAALPLPARLEALAAFPFPRAGADGVLYWAVVPSPELLALHAQVGAALEAAGAQLRPVHLPGRWTPHVTLARRLAPGQLAAAFDVLGNWTAAHGNWTAARTYDTTNRTAEPLGAAG